MSGDAVEPADAVAIVGIGCRVPGAEDPRTLWRRLVGGAGSVRRYDRAELLAAGWPAALLDDPAYVPAAGHLDGAAGFDAAFFGIDGREAELTDPQQRLFLEVAWAALEDAGLDPAAVDGPVGVFAGAGPNRYAVRNLLGNPAAGPAGDPTDAAGLLGPTLSADYLPTRVSYRLDLTGPSVAVQTACSSSLVAVCLAVQALQDYRCDLAVAGGASLATAGPAPVGGYLARPGLTAPDGVCRPFDRAAAGTVPGSGAAAVVLKRLADAVADGDPVQAVVLGWGVGNDGAARAGFEAPGLAGQLAAVREALAAAAVDPATVGYVEAHGSGTPVGDALEVEALTRGYRSELARPGPCLLGSGKAALGNLDAASGVVGLVAAALAVRHGTVPVTLNLRDPHPDLDLGSGPFRLATATVSWPLDGGPRRAAVTSIGQGGTTAHLLVQQPPPAPPAGPDDGTVRVLPLSARTPAALARAAGRLADLLADGPEPALRDVAWTLATGRRAFEHRVAVLCRDRGEAIARLRSVHAGGPVGAGGVAGPAAGAAAGSEGAGPVRAGGVAGEAAAAATGWEVGVGGPAGAAAEWEAGGAPDWPALFGADRPRRVPLPSYPFERVEYWIAPRDAGR